ncbi:MAG: tRNA preQ1(34) S-adenosylmethionine ribosyltransferase-isomerase QueA [Candidatus Aenigmarchaeota archaeon]|nr:tRNA preQ1(34) S-adenosylmethionine ribosyltransferase-isomerase QueA [Candidatus Aenigmarchaeota archaeon]
MDLLNFDYVLPKELIAQTPITQRDASRLMAVSDMAILHKKFTDIIDYFSEGDVLVLNDSKVFPAKLAGKKETGGKVEILLLKQINKLKWECLTRGKTSNKILFGNITGTVQDNVISFSEDIIPHLQQLGKTPLPPYIKSYTSLERYNTVYAEKEGSAAAPTAGLHFTPELLKKIENKGVIVAKVTLHVGLGTFLPVKEQEIENHKMHSEFFSISKETADKINNRKGKLFVVGTTSIRALESAAKDGKVLSMTGETSIFIYPGHKWKLNYAGIITNFHLPKSSLLMLVSAFLSRERIMEAYQEAIKERYRFYSFGDAMIILSYSK